jgi:hypothetical protein
MIEALVDLLNGSALSQSLRASVWLYPLVNTGHVLGIALLFGAIAPLDLRLLGCWREVALAPLARVLVPMAMTGLVLALTTGALLFATRPRDYIFEPVFLIKLALLAAAILNALALRRLPEWSLLRVEADAGYAIPTRWRFAALASIVLWLGVITAGRLIGYR